MPAPASAVTEGKKTAATPLKAADLAEDWEDEGEKEEKIVKKKEFKKEKKSQNGGDL